jgi:putative hydrolase of the HAD superfamily
MPSAILFDLDDTLNDRRASLAHYAGVFMGRFESRLRLPDPTGLAAKIRQADRGGYRPKEEMFAELRQTLPWRKAPDVEELLAHWYDHFHSSIQARAGVREVLAALRARDFTLGLVTNGRTVGQNRTIDALGLRAFFSTIVISEEAGMAKPNPAIFLQAVNRLGVRPAEAWFVGDHPVNDIAGSAGAGLKPIWLRGAHSWPADQPKPAITIETLEQLLQPALNL